MAAQEKERGRVQSKNAVGMLRFVQAQPVAREQNVLSPGGHLPVQPGPETLPARRRVHGERVQEGRDAEQVCVGQHIFCVFYPRLMHCVLHSRPERGPGNVPPRTFFPVERGCRIGLLRVCAGPIGPQEQQTVRHAPARRNHVRPGQHCPFVDRRVAGQLQIKGRKRADATATAGQAERARLRQPVLSPSAEAGNRRRTGFRAEGQRGARKGQAND